MTEFRKSPDPETIPAEYWDTKHPKAPIIYEGRSIPGTRIQYPVDVRRFIWAPDVILDAFSRSGDPWMEAAREASGPDIVAWMIQKWVVQNIVYVGDEDLSPDRGEFWLFPAETLKRRRGDCEDGAILTVSLCLALGIPADRIRVAAGWVDPGRGAAAGGHAWATYRRESDDAWVALDWCYYPDADVQVPNKIPLKGRDEYFAGDRVWFSFNHLHAWTHESAVSLKGRIRKAERVEG